MTLISIVSTSAYYLSILAGLFISSVVALLYLFQTRLIYPSSIPEHSRTIVDTPDKHNMPHYLSITLKTTDNESLDCYHIQQSVNSDPKVITLYFHANAGNMGHRLPIARQIQMYLGCDVFMVSYRGYGKSTGNPFKPSSYHIIHSQS